MAQAERRQGLRVLPVRAFDIRAGPDGASWDVDKPADRGAAIRISGACRPHLLIGSLHAPIGAAST
eukprot:11226031-Alexandrium_andersonii.AAC.1